MHDESQTTQNRRAWLRTSLRWSALAGLSAMSLGLLVRGRVDPRRSACLRRVPCQDCAKLARCGNPRAIRVKKREQRHG